MCGRKWHIQAIFVLLCILVSRPEYASAFSRLPFLVTPLEFHRKNPLYPSQHGSNLRPTTAQQGFIQQRQNTCLRALGTGEKKAKDKSTVETRTGFSNACAHFLKSLWKGIALPFPALRRVVLHPALQSGSEKLSIGLTLREGIIAMISYFGLGVVAYSFMLEKWSIVDSLYFTCVCFSTVGYGDLCPTSPASELFTCVFGFGGIAFLGAAVATVGSRVVQAEMNAVSTARKQSRKRIMHIFEGMPHFLDHFHKQTLDEQAQSLKRLRQDKSDEYKQDLSPRSWSAILAKGIVRVLPSATIILMGGVIMQKLNGAKWSWIESVYYSLVTASTIGFGDFVPQTRAAKIFGTFFIPLSVAAAGELLSSVAMSLVEKRQRQVYTKQLEHDLTMDHLHIMDADQDGKITREEYVQFMLIEMGRVTDNELQELFTQFDRLDVTQSGYLDHEDLKLMAKLRGATVKEKNS